MKNASLMIIAGLALMACTPSEPTQTASTTTTTVTPAAEPAPATPAPTEPATDTCSMAQYAALVGKPAADPGVPAASASVRLIKPGDQVTMDFSAARLNIDINAAGVITGLRCG